MLTQERLKELLHYDPDTGVFTWKASRGRVRAGSVAGSPDGGRGYIMIRIDGKKHLAHRLAFLYVNDAFPPAGVDHIDHCSTNNRLANLRLATQAENCKNSRININNTSGYKGVTWDKSKGKWMAQARLNITKYYLGRYPTAEEASAAYEAFAKEHHGEFYYSTRTGGTTREVI